MSALEELAQALDIVEQHLTDAGALLGTTRKSLGEAERALVKLDPEHPETVVPPNLHRADDQVERAQEMIEHILGALHDFTARL
ncbi:hypothetical protein SAMN05421805_110176 [Saccharopolyspora antimicrobica]|uniref:Uncharacterized protein n=1 Tax=Saccharopolyspora antimicrobica TaxID=455193 RepID=A0A1I5F5L5_9PSEU|nr:hypothetical protein [Saccharopolyspora antimicrobica]RKT83676.1 hypothetical protein ATL45_1970 [Saccharopolyspora antimicrobica]SFO18601.1 hypothetical protein SAMN05421805_110176 [Saccharopolyspora antimicrobica]